MSNQQHTINSRRVAKRDCLATRILCGRVLNLIVLIFMLSSAISAPALANGAQRTRAQAVEIAKSRSGDGRVLSVEKKVNKNGDSVFAVKIIANGRVKVYAIREFAK